MAYRVMLITALMWLSGCQLSRPAGSAPPVQTLSAEGNGEAVTASALVFDPPIAQDEPRLELSRADREPGVAVGYDGPITERYYIRMDDRQIHNGYGGGWGWGGGGSGSYDRYERRAITERSGVRYR